MAVPVFLAGPLLVVGEGNFATTQVGITTNEPLKAKIDHYNALSWYVDIFTCLLKNLFIYFHMVLLALPRLTRTKTPNSSPFSSTPPS